MLVSYDTRLVVYKSLLFYLFIEMSHTSIGQSFAHTISLIYITRFSLQWRHNERNGVPNHQRYEPFNQAQIKKHQSSASLANVRGIRRWSVNSPYKGPVTRKMFPFNDVIMIRNVAV